MRAPPSFLILGAGSAIGQALAQLAAAAGCPLVLAARNVTRLEGFAAALGAQFNITVDIAEFDALAPASHSKFLDRLAALPDIAVCFVGVLGDQKTAERDFAETDRIVRSNLLGPVSILGEVANRMTTRGHGAIIAVSSVAGERGRSENYVYGAAKAGLTVFLSGMRQRFGSGPIRVVTIKPGLVRSGMTANRGNFLMTTPERIAPRLLAACLHGRGVVYLPWYWRVIMGVIRAIPEPIFRRFPIAS